MDDRERTILGTLCQVVGVQFRALHMLYESAAVRENALKQILGRRGLLTDEEWDSMQEEVKAGAAVEHALGFTAEQIQELQRVLGQLDPILADKDGAVLKPVVDSLKQMSNAII